MTARKSTAHESFQSPTGPGPGATLDALRTALAHALERRGDDEEARLFRAAREAARRDRVPPAELVRIIQGTWAELARSAGVAGDQKADALADTLARCLESIVEYRNGDRSHGR